MIQAMPQPLDLPMFVSPQTVTIDGEEYGADDAGQDFTFSPGTVLQPGRRIRTYTNEVHPEWGGFSYGSKRPIWNDKGDSAQLRDPNNNVVSEYGYGSKTPKP